MKIKGKGKVYPSPSSSSSSYKDAISVMKLLPAAILALALPLPPQDREVLAYMITRSLSTTTTNPPSTLQHHKKKSNGPTTTAAAVTANVPKHPLFECGCFDCYTSFWFRWDSSPNREIIHQAIEAFEDHLTNGESSKRNGRGRKRDKVVGRRRHTEIPAGKETETAEISVAESEVVETEDVEENVGGCEDEVVVAEVTGNLEMEEEEEDVLVAAAAVQAPASNHKGLARKVLPDVVGLLNSRLWSLWSPNI
ncbi:hypothetical protein L1049_027959 [Liquidambar formosana]|uniref:Uncharacterized protein n=1 Tax=Liquidambar formosana TaxID=63359 RepID=A0AAP0WSW0_LIQFO